MSSMDTLVSQAKELTESANAVLATVSGNKDKIRGDRKTAIDESKLVNEQYDLAVADSVLATSAANATKTAKATAKVISISQAPSATPAANKLPAMDSNGKINKGWLPEHHKVQTPTPDLWLPLNDSLVMETGRGDFDQIDVAGKKYELHTRSADFSRSTKATYVNKSGHLVEADVNEPRFEKEGILVEGNSTNLSSGIVRYSALDHEKVGLFERLTPQKSTEKNQNYRWMGCRLPIGKAINNAFSISYFINPMGKRYTRWELAIPARRVGSNDQATNIYIGSTVDLYGPSKQGRCEVKKYSDSLYKVSGLIFDDSAEYEVAGDASTYLFVMDDKGNRHYTSDGKQFTEETTYIQVEQLPFSTSFIPVQDKPVTRARDSLKIPAGNVPNFTDEGTYSFYFDCQQNSTYKYIMGTTGAHRTGNRWAFVTYDENVKTEFFYGNNAINTYKKAIKKGMVAHTFKDKVSKGYLSGQIAGKNKVNRTVDNPESYIGFGHESTLHSLHGHIRDFRIWRKQLSEEQIASL